MWFLEKEMTEIKAVIMYMYCSTNTTCSELLLHQNEAVLCVPRTLILYYWRQLILSDCHLNFMMDKIVQLGLVMISGERNSCAAEIIFLRYEFKQGRMNVIHFLECHYKKKKKSEVV